MFTEITIDGKTIGMAPNAATPIRYRQIFGKDLYRALDNPNGVDLDVVSELAFVMFHQNKKTNMNELNMDRFIGWLEGFSPMAFIDAAEDVINAYTGQTTTTSTP